MSSIGLIGLALVAALMMFGEAWEKHVSTQAYEWTQDVKELLEEAREMERQRRETGKRGRYAACPCQRGRRGLPFETKKKDRPAVERQAA